VALSESSPSGPVLCQVGVIGDIHSEDEALALAIQHFTEAGIDTLLSVGDVVDGAGDVNRACSLIQKHGVLAVCGNHDRWILRDSHRNLPGATASSPLRDDCREWLFQLPQTRSFQTPRGPLLLCHGLGEDDMAALRPDDQGYALESNLALDALVRSKRYRFVINGHTHLPMVRSIRQLTIINAGTLCRFDRQVCSVVDFEQGNVEFFNIKDGRVSRAERFTLV
jgi:putative phosphoesterase